MAVSPLRLTAALVFGGMVTGGLYLTQQANGRPLAVASPEPAAKPRAERPASAQPRVALPQPKAVTPAKAAQATMPLATAPKRIVFRQTAPGDVVLTLAGEELQVQFVPAAQPPAVKKVAKAKISSLPPHKATPVATP